MKDIKEAIQLTAAIILCIPIYTLYILVISLDNIIGKIKGYKYD